MTGFAQAAASLGHMDFARYLPPHRLGHTHKSLQCVLPNGEATFGHVMEMIDGPTASETTADELGLDEVGVFNLVQTFFFVRLLCTDRFTS
jgi:serine/threonine protein kinase